MGSELFFLSLVALKNNYDPIYELILNIEDVKDLIGDIYGRTN